MEENKELFKVCSNTYDAVSENVQTKSNDEKLLKYLKISSVLANEDIFIENIDGNIIHIYDKNSDFKTVESISTWGVFKIVDIVNFILGERSRYFENKKNEINAEKLLLAIRRYVDTEMSIGNSSPIMYDPSLFISKVSFAVMKSGVQGVYKRFMVTVEEFNAKKN